MYPMSVDVGPGTAIAAKKIEVKCHAIQILTRTHTTVGGRPLRRAPPSRFGASTRGFCGGGPADLMGAPTMQCVQPVTMVCGVGNLDKEIWRLAIKQRLLTFFIVRLAGRN